MGIVMEKRQKKIRKGNQIMTVLATVIILLSAGISVVRYGKIDIREYENQVRILTSEHHVQVEQGIYEPWEYPYLVCDLAGVVLYADEAFQKQEGDRVNVQETLGMDESFGKSNQGMIKKSFVLEQDDKVNGFVVYLIPEDALTGSDYDRKLLWCIMPAGVGVIVSVLLLSGRLLFCNSRVLGPIGEISASAKQIIRGNYEYEFRSTSF